jgi:glucuronate isomerase
MLKNHYLVDKPNHPLAREIYKTMRKYSILSPHGHIDSAMLAANKNFANPVELLIIPDHYITRMLHGQGISYEALGIPQSDGRRNNISPEEVWRTFAANWHLFRSTPSRIWFQETLTTIFHIDEILNSQNADDIYQKIDGQLQSPEFLPQALFRKFNIEVLATTDGTSDSLQAHQDLAKLEFGGRVIPTFRPDDVSDPQRPNWRLGLDLLSQSAGIPIESFVDLLRAIRLRREYFIRHGATATDHGVFSPRTLKLSDADRERLFITVNSGSATAQDFDNFRAVMLFEHGRMAADDGMVMQLHSGSLRNYDSKIFNAYGADRGFDIPTATTYTKELQPLLNEVGNHPNFRMVLFTLDESTYSRELAPLAGAYSGVRLGSPWWFHDSLNGLERWRDAITETAGFYNTVGFIDDTRAFCSIPVRHDVARRFDAGYLAREVDRNRITESEAHELAGDLAYNLSKKFFNL